MEQLAGGDRTAELDGDGGLPAEPTIDFNTEIAKVRDNHERMLAEAEREADDATCAAELRVLSCQDLLSFVTEDGVFTPTRVPQGACDSALHFQLQVHACFQEMLYTAVLIWIDGILLYARSKDEYLEKLEQFFVILRERGFKLNALKCRLFARSVRWCRNIVTGQEVKHDPSRLAALVDIELPPTAAALQQFLCAANWIRDTVVDFARVFAPLQHKLEAVMATRGRRRQQLTGVDLT
ncbi:unnamed protein product [Phytophthora lilii]|uniref:Unnamed protein product n=1 Tax=Phytophthora lilii TaxID=2077276 RepID=A0A9W6TN34_9STRA|nr:unnamed protein product [Phytophthora lilii]